MSAPLLAAALGLLFAAGGDVVAEAAAPPGQGSREPLTGPPNWRLVAHSTLIAVGTLNAPPERTAPIAFHLSEDRQLKRPEGAALSFVQIHYLRDRTSRELTRRVQALNGRKVVAFIHQSEGEYYFTGRSPESLQPFSQTFVTEAQEEIARQRKIVAEGESLRRARRDPQFVRVKEIISRMTNPDEQERSFTQLEEIGAAAVPAIIAAMDDRRSLPIRRISLANKSPNAFEGLRHYTAPRRWSMR